MQATDLANSADGTRGANGPADELGAHLHGMWSAVASGWAEHAAWADARGAAVTDAMLELAAVMPGQRVSS